MAMHVTVEALLAAVRHRHRSPGAQRQQAQVHMEAEILSGTVLAFLTKGKPTYSSKMIVSTEI